MERGDADSGISRELTLDDLELHGRLKVGDRVFFTWHWPTKRRYWGTITPLNPGCPTKYGISADDIYILQPSGKPPIKFDIGNCSTPYEFISKARTPSFTPLYLSKNLSS